MKPIKRGYKIWCRADMSGYIYEFDVYQGKSEENDMKERFGLGGSVVEKLTLSLKGDNYTIMVDNYFTSVELFEYLRANKIFACGTVRPNRKHLPTMKSDKELKRGEFDFSVTDQGISYFKWKDNRCVHLLSNFHGNETCSLSRREKDGSEKDVRAPKIVQDYNKSMGGVDKADMLRAMYDRDRRSKKWWHRLFFALLEITLVNSFVIYQELHGKLPLLQFKRQVTRGLLTNGTMPAKKRGRPSEITSPADPAKRKNVNFFCAKGHQKAESWCSPADICRKTRKM